MHSGPDATEALLMHMDAGKIPMEVTIAKVEAYAGAQSTRCALPSRGAELTYHFGYFDRWPNF